MSVRLDKYLWAVRVFKSRTAASESISGGKVKVKGSRIKPSREVKPGELLTVQSGYIQRKYRVIALLEKRVSAKLVSRYIEDVTPEEELEKLKTERFISYVSRYKGSGRPTKKDRRLFDRLKSS